MNLYPTIESLAGTPGAIAPADGNYTPGGTLVSADSDEDYTREGQSSPQNGGPALGRREIPRFDFMTASAPRTR
jgi:hypothetical protein